MAIAGQANLVGTTPWRFPSPLRYPGGKGKVANYLKLVILENALLGHEYVEPYAGGASVALSLLYEEFVSHIHINDVDRGVSSFWKSVLESPGDLCDLIATVPITMEEWERQRTVRQQAETGDFDALELGFATFFLNRTNRSGIIAGGPIGGRDQDGPWKLEARFNREDLVRRVRKVARFKNRISVTGLDAETFLDRWTTPTEALIFLDPPYYKKGSGLYTNYYGLGDHVRIATLTTLLRASWIVAYDAAPEILALYPERPRVEYSLSYSAADRYRGREVMFFGPNLKAPGSDGPANVPTEVVDAARLAGARSEFPELH